MFATGTLRKKWGMRFLDATDEAEEIFFLVQIRSDSSPLAEDASFQLAELFISPRGNGSCSRCIPEIY